jgi:ankyrin repeat protein
MVDKQDADGNTPLWRAVFESRGEGETISTLLAAGANPDLPSKSGVSARDLAARIGNFDVARFFQAGA